MVSACQFLWTALVYVSYAASQSTSVIRVDDWQAFSDVNRYGIQYGPGWIQRGFQDPIPSYYRGTYASTHTTGSYAMLSFRGTGISYNADKGPDSGITLLAIDGEQLPALNPNSLTVEHQQAIFTLSGLAPGDHQVVVGTQPGYVSQTGVVGLDFFGVTPLDEDMSYIPQNLGPGARTVPVNAIIVDDEESSIQYSGESWKLYDVNTIGPTPLFFNLTQHTSRDPGSSLNFTFHGTGVWYFSDDFPSNADVLISVDGGEGELVKTYGGAAWVSQRLYWSKTGLSDGEHVVTVTHAGQRGQYANLDFFMYLPSSSTSESHPINSAPAHVGAIVGGVIGGIVGLSLVILGLLLVCRRYTSRKVDIPKDAESVKPSAHHLDLAKTMTQDSEATFDKEKTRDEIDMV